MVQVQRDKSSYAAQFESLQMSDRGSVAPWLRELRQDAFRRFEALGFPTTRHEDWKYTNVAAIARLEFLPALAPGAEKGANSLSDPAGDSVADLPGLVFEGGQLESSRPYNGQLPPGVQLRDLASALSDTSNLIETHLARHADYEDNGFVALNTAFIGDGAFVYVPSGIQVSTPIHLVFHPADSAQPTVSHPRNLIIVEEGARAVVLERYVGTTETYLTNAVTEIVLGPGARLEYYKVQSEGQDAHHISTTNVALARDSSFSSFYLDIGAKLGRNDLDVEFLGEGGSCSLNGLYITQDGQHIDNHTSVDHKSSFTPSKQLYKGILNGDSRAVFNGKVIARRGTHQVDAHQTNRNLLMSGKSQVNTKPQLEIFADDLKCSHGATVGQLDEEAIFYLASRGIGPEDARRILTYAFAEEVLAKAYNTEVRDLIVQLVKDRLSLGVEAGVG